LAASSLAGLSRAVRRLGLTRQRGRLSVHSPDPAYAAKRAWIARALAAARATAAAEPVARVTVLYGDEFSLRRQPTLGPTWAPAGAEPVARLASRANTAYRFSAALDPTTGRVTWLGRSPMGAGNLVRFRLRLRRADPAGRLLLIWDNWPPHHAPRALEAAGTRGIALLWLPTSAPWLNPIEKRWRWLKQERLHHHRLAEHWPELRAQVTTWLDQFAGPSLALLRYTGLLPD
jgi:transposase